MQFMNKSTYFSCVVLAWAVAELLQLSMTERLLLAAAAGVAYQVGSTILKNKVPVVKNS